MRPLSGKRVHATAQAGMKRDLIAGFTRVSDQVRGVLNRFANLDGIINRANENAVRRDVRRNVTAFFVDPLLDAAYGSDGFTALAPYPDLLNLWYVYVVAGTVRAHNRWMERNLPDDIYQYLSSTPARPLQIEESRQRQIIREQDGNLPQWIQALRIFQPNPLAELDPSRRWVPMQRWTDPNGYQLSDRIWRTGNDIRQKIDEIVALGIREGRSAVDIADAVEAYLVPTEQGRRTLKPYGPKYMPGGAASSAIRLARTEIARAANHASFTTGYLNPYTKGYDVLRSANGDPLCPICPQHATIDIGGSRVREPYGYEGGGSIPPYHPNDMCYTAPALIEDTRAVTERLRQIVQSPAEYPAPIMTPARPDEFIHQLLVGQNLFDYTRRLVQLGLPL